MEEKIMRRKSAVTIAAEDKLKSEVRVDTDLSNRVADLIHEGFDLAIRVGELPDLSGLSARKLGEVRYALYASPKYLDHRPAPSDPVNLADHDLVMFSPAPPPIWHLVNSQDNVDIAGPARLTVNNNIAARDAAAEGFGIALLPCFQVEPLLRDGGLVELLPGWARTPVPVHAVFPSSRYLSPSLPRTLFELTARIVPGVGQQFIAFQICHLQKILRFASWRSAEPFCQF
jgi:LysR family transcriptional regulator for bpeEF and oprC